MGNSVFRSRILTIGQCSLGGDLPVRIQSMTNTSTMDTLSTVRQVERLVQAGCELVRITARNVEEARNLANIKKELRSCGIEVPLIADIHFNPEAAVVAAQIVDKVRINPGNYVDRPTAGKKRIAFTEADYQSELDRIAERLQPLIKICNEEGTAIRVGTNHGSLSQRILDRFGNTPLGMVESAMEFVRIFTASGFQKLVLSMKSSDIHIMEQSYRLLVKRMRAEHFDFPLHLGVTEAGAGEDGVVKSACGMGPLLAEGIGDTIRVSLTGAPESEIPAARQLVELYQHSKTRPEPAFEDVLVESASVKSSKSGIITEWLDVQNPLDVLFSVTGVRDPVGLDGGVMVPVAQWNHGLMNSFPYFASVKEYSESKNVSSKRNYILIDSVGLAQLPLLKDKSGQMMLILEATSERARKIYTDIKGLNAPWMLAVKVHTKSTDSLTASVQWAARVSEFLNDGGIQMIWCSGGGSHHEAYQIGLSILQSHGLRRSKAEFVSCPSCGRTEFDIEMLLEAIKRATSHLIHLKIAVMGCIVNGPGEMADADYGCVGMGKGEVALYKAGKQVKTHVLQKDAADELCAMIRQYGDWELS